jgi:hypothetical protein
VSDYAQFSEYPDECVVKIPLGEGEVEALAEFLTRDFDRDRIARAQAEWLNENATLEKTVAGYVDALSQSPLPSGEGAAKRRVRGVQDRTHSAAEEERPGLHAPHPAFGHLLPGEKGVIPLFPSLAVVKHDNAHLTLRNTGGFTIRTRSYEQPGYRLIAKLFDGEKEIDSRWIELPRDLAPGDDVSITIPFRRGAALRLYHAIESVPMLEPEPWYAAAL